MEHGEVFCVKGLSCPGRGGGGEGKAVKRREVLGEARQEGSGREGSDA